MSARRRAGLASLIIGLVVVLGVRLVPGLGGPPLYDGVVPVGPYQWLTPGPGQQGGAKGATATVAVNGGQNDLLAIATQESLPQAQLLAIPGSLVLRPGATSLQVAISPVPPPGEPTDGTLASNVYRFEVKDQNGADATARASAKVSIVLRSADATLLTGIVERWDGSAWTPLKTAPPGVSGAYLATVTEFGDYAVVQPGRAASPAPSGASAASTGPKPTAASGASGLASATVPPGSSAAMGDDTASGGPALVGPIAVAALVALVAFAVIVLLRRRSGPPPTDPPAPKPGRKPRGAKSPPYRGAHRVGRD